VELVSPLVATFPRTVISRLAGGASLSRPSLVSLLSCCQAGLVDPRDLRGGKPGCADWDPVAEPVRWELVTWVAARATEAPADHQILAALTWLLWDASFWLTATSEPTTDSESDLRLVGVLERVIEARPQGVADILLRTLYRVQRGRGPALFVNASALRWLRFQAFEDGSRNGPEGFLFATMQRMAYLDSGPFAGFAHSAAREEMG